MTRKLIVLLFLSVIFNTANAQYETAINFLQMQQSPLFNGAGGIGAAIRSSDASGFLLNPAQLGNFSKENNLSLFFMPQKSDWTPNSYSDISINSFALAAGYNFKNSKYNFPLSVGIGYSNNKMDFPEWGGYDKYDCFSIGAGYEYYLDFNIGFAVKSFTSRLSDKPVAWESKPSEATGSAVDFGLMITAPVSKLAFNNLNFKIGEQITIKPVLDFTLGYSATNIGKEIYYIDPAQADALPRTARLGYTFDFAINSIINKIQLKVLGYSFTAEAGDILVERKTIVNSFSDTVTAAPEYQSMLGDINFGRNLIELKGDDNVVVHKGHIFRLFETFTFATGRYYGAGINNIKSNSFGVSSEGLFKIINICLDNSILNYIANHFVIEYYDSNVFAETKYETNIKGIVLNYKGLNL